MNQVIELLDRAKEKTGSDRQTALEINESPQVLSNIRNGHYGMNVTIGAKLAVLIGEEWASVLAAIEEEQAKDTETKKFWRGLRGIAASVVPTLLVLWNASEGCILCQIKPRLNPT